MKSFDPFFKQNLFYKYKLKISQDEINQIILILKNINFKNDLQSSTYSHLNILNFPVLKNLRQQIVDILDNHSLYLKNNWAQNYNKDDEHVVHTHPHSSFSGIIYLTSEGSPTIFYNKDFETYKNKVEKNTLILFPSWIPHEVKPLTKNEERLIISFNTEKK
tara:strand:+ start:216 stop:701 length:486 start_codon:yes stop_codon:yes gene_type:complete